MLYGLHGVLTKMQTKSIPYTFNRGGYYYFTRRVPSDLIDHYSYPRVVQGLRTSSPTQAKTRALIAAAKLDEYWCRLRMTDPELIGSHLLKDPKTALVYLMLLIFMFSIKGRVKVRPFTHPFREPFGI